MEIKQKLKIKGKNTPVFIEGEEPGVIAFHTFDLPDDWTPIDVMRMDNLKQKLIDDNIEVVSAEVKYE